MKEIVAIILFLVPSLNLAKTEEFAESFQSASGFYRVDVCIPLIKTLFESQYIEDAVSRWNDHGLMQLRVSKSTRPEYIGDEEALFHPDTNIWLGLEALHFWRRHHNTHCFIWLDHRWLDHYKWGYKVPKGYQDKKFWKLFKRVSRKFPRVCG